MYASCCRLPLWVRVHLSGPLVWVSLPHLVWRDWFFQLVEGSVRSWQGRGFYVNAQGVLWEPGGWFSLRHAGTGSSQLARLGDVSAAFLGGCAHSSWPWQRFLAITFSLGWEGCQGGRHPG